ncbi:pseudaminic acid cytidylyltransferase [Geomesophilobacter sediminis]|uniref:Pseudaminic acid cytidylyltransferase n=1 Tax=Geomesophilobacter sediminis TaxID=2798584 RepID=A0A8J7J738_9BACT|nr:pseudaminic acid cytidylyltransferase [Geomesophilobacter sediminis]MBJ6724841.1 pseudaminic acid cytidylyltransferase [Geomesophilobacter sediminis]
MNLALIPARGGSKRIPRKNIRAFAGKPIIGYSIEAARECGLFDRIVVSTDDEEIAEVARSFGADIPFLRPKQLADDHTGTSDVVKHAIEWFATQGTPISHACCIYATAPFLQPSFLQEGYEKLVATGKSYAFAVTSFAFPVQRAIRLRPDGTVEPLYPEHVFTRSQDLEETYHDAGQFLWGRSDAFLNGTVAFSPASVPVILPRHLVQDIDTPEDWTRAELMFRAWRQLAETL